MVIRDVLINLLNYLLERNWHSALLLHVALLHVTLCMKLS